MSLQKTCMTVRGAERRRTRGVNGARDNHDEYCGCHAKRSRNPGEMLRENLPNHAAHDGRQELAPCAGTAVLLFHLSAQLTCTE